MQRYTLEIAGKHYSIDVQELAADRFRVKVGGEEFEVGLASQDLGPASRPIEHKPAGTTPLPQAPAQPGQPQVAEGGFRAELKAPMPGTILSVAVAPGDKVSFGQALLTLEAMKMKNAIKAPHAAVVANVLVQPGQAVNYGDVLLRFEEALG